MWLKLLEALLFVLEKFMARSIADIPFQYRHATAKEAFILWLADLPVHVQVKRRLIKVWSAHTRVLFSRHDYINAKAPLRG